MLAGITASDLEALLAFIYQGEVSVDPSQLPSLLQAAHCLDITALSPTILSTDVSQYFQLLFIPLNLSVFYKIFVCFLAFCKLIS